MCSPVNQYIKSVFNQADRKYTGSYTFHYWIKQYDCKYIYTYVIFSGVHVGYDFNIVECNDKDTIIIFFHTHMNNENMQDNTGLPIGKCILVKRLKINQNVTDDDTSKNSTL